MNEEGVSDRFAPGSPGPQPLFCDTSALYAYFYRRTAQHEEMVAFFDALAHNRLPYRPLLTNQYVVDELVSLLLSDAGHEAAVAAIETILDSTAITLLSVGDETFAAAIEQFRTYDDQTISLTDHTIAHQATEHDATHILTYDTDFRTLEFSTVPYGER